MIVLASIDARSPPVERLFCRESLAALKSDEEVNGSHMGCALYLVLIQATPDGTPVHTVAAYQDIEARVTLHDGEVRIQPRAEEGEGPVLN
jgi:hypothetical protein